MSFLRFWREHNKQGSSNRELLGFDLLYQLSYMSGISAAGIPRSQIFQLGAQLPTCAARYFDEVNRLTRLNYGYAEACRMVGESVQEQEVKSLLLRLAGSLLSGEPEVDFLEREARVQAESYNNLYERQLESLKRWTDAYTALIVSAVLIVVVAAMSTLLYDLGTTFVTGLVSVTMAIGVLGAWIVYRGAPREVKTLSGPHGHGSQRLARTLFLALAPAAAGIGTVLGVAGLPMGVVLIAVAFVLLPIGVVASRYDSLVDKHDNDIGTFLRVLGATASATGTTLQEAFSRVDIRATASLALVARRLVSRLRSRASPELCWRRFVVETGSEVISRSVRVFTDGVSLGGEPEEVGSRASLLAVSIGFMRAKRRIISSTFARLSLVMHVITIFLLLFAVEIVGGFGRVVESAGVAGQAAGQGPPLTIILNYSFQQIQFLERLMIPVVIGLSLVNAMAPKVAEGGYSLKLFLYLSLTLLGSGLSMLAAPKVADIIFNLGGVV